jgi:hypothetical protein
MDGVVARAITALMGLLSDAEYIPRLACDGLVTMARKGLRRLYVHASLMTRYSHSGRRILEKLRKFLRIGRTGRIATVLDASTEWTVTVVGGE